MSESIEMVKIVAQHLGLMRDDVVFLGGAVLALLTTDPAASEARPTKDVDVIVDVASRAEYARLEADLRAVGFANDRSEGSPICRWKVGDVRVDVMPTDASLLGFGNRWFGEATAHATPRRVGRYNIRLVTAPYFLATKLEAFAGRGCRDFRASHDLEDLIALIDGRPELAIEVEAASSTLRSYLAGAIGELLDDPEFLDALPGHLRGDSASQERDQVVLTRMGILAGRQG